MTQEEDPELNGVEDEVEAAIEAVAAELGNNGDSRAEVERHIKPEVRALYDVYSYRHAASILATSYPQELEEIQNALLEFRITVRDIGMPGGNESIVPKKFSRILRPVGWIETRIQGDLCIRLQEYDEKESKSGKVSKIKRKEAEAHVIKNFIDGHKIDYVKGRVAFDLEWNSKDQTFDRDLYALRTFHECGLISAGVLVTRSNTLNPVFDKVPKLDKSGNPTGGNVRDKFGASTTWIGKVLYRLNAGRHGGCPILVFAITPKLIEDWEP